MQPHTRIILPIIAYAAALALIGASAAMNAAYAMTLATSQLTLIAWLAASIGADGLKALGPLAIAASVRRSHYVTALAAGVLTVLCVDFSLAAAIGFAATARDTGASGRSATADDRARLENAYTTAASALAATPAARPAGEVTAEIDKRLADPRTNRCERINGPISRALCGEVAELRGELARASEVVRLQERADQARNALAALPAAMERDPQAAAMAAYGAALGFTVEPARIAPWLSALAALLLETGSLLGLLIASTLYEKPDHVPTPHRQTAGLNQPAHEPPAPAAQEAPIEPSARPAMDPKRAKALAALHSGGGRLVGTQRGLADLIGLPTTTAHRVWRDLASEGLVRIDPKPDGTTIELVN